MLDYFCIFTKGGALLWTIQLTALRGNPIDVLVSSALLQSGKAFCPCTDDQMLCGTGCAFPLPQQAHVLPK